MVNQAIENLVIEQFSENAWERIKDRASVEDDAFISNESYPDCVTYQLVANAEAELKIPATAILESFGEYGVLNTAQKGYGHLLHAGGKSLGDFLVNLPNFHSRVMLAFPDFHPATFQVSDLAAESLRLHAISHRPGLSYFVIGLIHGLGKMFGTPVEVESLELKDRGSDHDVFLIRWTSLS